MVIPDGCCTFHLHTAWQHFPSGFILLIKIKKNKMYEQEHIFAHYDNGQGVVLKTGFT